MEVTRKFIGWLPRAICSVQPWIFPRQWEQLSHRFLPATREPREEQGCQQGGKQPNTCLSCWAQGGWVAAAASRAPPPPPNLHWSSGDSLRCFPVPGPDPWQEFPFSPISQAASNKADILRAPEVFLLKPCSPERLRKYLPTLLQNKNVSSYSMTGNARERQGR